MFNPGEKGGYEVIKEKEDLNLREMEIRLAAVRIFTEYKETYHGF